jgi:elongation factor 3
MIWSCADLSQWRYQDGHDREMMEKATRVLTEEDREMMDRPIEGKNGELRKIEFILGRQKLKKSFQYEVKFKNMDQKVSPAYDRDYLHLLRLLNLNYHSLTGDCFNRHIR